MNCHACGEEISTSTTFCPNCGAYLGAKPEEDGVSQPTETTINQTADGQSASQQPDTSYTPNSPPNYYGGTNQQTAPVQPPVQNYQYGQQAYQQPYQQPYQQQPYYQNYQPYKTTQPTICLLLSIFLGGFVFGILGVIFSALAIGKINSANRKLSVGDAAGAAQDIKTQSTFMIIAWIGMAVGIVIAFFVGFIRNF